MKKVKKWQKQKNRKTQKHENQKSEKHQKWSKNAPPLKKAKMSLKWPKTALCEIRAAWSGVFSIPGGTTGPGFKAEIRPPLFSLFFDTFYHFFTFSFWWFCQFWWFCKCDKLMKLIKCPFFDTSLCNVIRPYCNVMMSGRFIWGDSQERRMMMCGGFSPHLVCLFYCFLLFWFVNMSGRFTGEEM